MYFLSELQQSVEEEEFVLEISQSLLSELLVLNMLHQSLIEVVLGVVEVVVVVAGESYQLVLELLDVGDSLQDQVQVRAGPCHVRQ